MGLAELRERLEELERRRDDAKTDEDREFFQSLITEVEEQIRELEREERTVGERRGAGVGRAFGLILGTLTAPIEDALDGNTNRRETQRRRRRYAEGGEHVGEAIGGFVEALRKKKK